MKKTILRQTGGLCAVLAAGLIALALVVPRAVTQRQSVLPVALVAAVLFVLAVILTAAAVELARTLRHTLYSYKNILLTGGVLFLAACETALAVQLVPGLAAGTLTAGDVFAAMAAFPRRFAVYALPVIGLMCLLVGISNVVLMKKEGFRLHNALSVLVAVLYIGGTALVYLLMHTVTGWADTTQNPWVIGGNAAFWLFCLLMICYFECVLAGTAVMGWLAARQQPALDKDYIIILGCSIDKKGGLLPLLRGRVNRAIRFAWEQEFETGRPVKYVPSGGQGPDEVLSEGSAMELYLLSRGAEDGEVFPEKKSADTLENMQFSKAVIDRLNPDARIAFATTNYHMLRSGILARQAGIADPQGVAGDTKWYFWPNGFVREFFGILVMHRKIHVWVAAVLAACCLLLAAAFCCR